jgi:hypothetical protein
MDARLLMAGYLLDVQAAKSENARWRTNLSTVLFAVIILVTNSTGTMLLIRNQKPDLKKYVPDRNFEAHMFNTDPNELSKKFLGQTGKKV